MSNKYINDPARIEYKKNLDELQKLVNPKPSKEELERREQEYMNRRITEGVCLDESE